MEEYEKVNSFFLDEFAARKNGFHTISTLVKLSEKNRDAFIEKIETKQDIIVIDRKRTNEALLGSLKSKFAGLVDYSFIAIFLVLLIGFKRIELVAVSIFPVVVSWIITAGIMGLAGLEFNIVNIIVCTLIFGIGVDYSIVMTLALQKEFTFPVRELPTYRTSILLSVATTILGIGVLAFAKHPALNSIAAISIVGMTSALLVAFIIQPIVFNFIATRRVQKGKAPLQLRSSLNTVLSFSYFGIGSLIMSLFSVALRLIPLKKTTKMTAFRYVISKFMKSVLYTNPFVSKRIINERNERFDKPAIIIANHTSFLDILVIGMLSRKFIFLVKDWVYNSPVFGPVVRKAGFYSVSQGLESGLRHLKQKVDEGYSLVVFPEGSRSQSNHIKRFHKGAFYLAEQFGLDIVPVIIHGTSEALPQGDFVVHDGRIAVKILDRITPDHPAFGTNYAERTKRVSDFVKEEFRKTRSQLEGVDYFEKTVLSSFDYKESKITKAIRKNFTELKDIYFRLNQYIPRNAKVAHVANDFGQTDIILALQEPQRRIDSFISDQEKRAVAKTSYILKKRSIHYPDNISEFTTDNYDVLLISDKDENDFDALIRLSRCVILLDTLHLRDEVIKSGYEIEKEDSKLLILKKRSGEESL
jgi:1-acyl-sn-glycerol-3-phosphate acyltransferase